MLERCRRRYGDVFRMDIRNERRWIVLADPDAIKQVFTGDPAVFHAGEGNEILLPLVGRHSVLLLDDDRHMRQRKLLLPPFHGDILSLLLQARDEGGRPLSDEELRDELVTLLVAGHETTATALSWALERLTRHPDKLERLRAELADGAEEYADAVVKETLRLRPVIPLVARQLTAPAEIGGWQLPAGVRLAPAPYLVHRREDVYPEPHAFRPERFLERPAGTYTWIPFGGGVRRCIGASFATFEMKRVLEAIVGRLDVRAADPASERIAHRAITLAPARGGEVVVRPLRGTASARAGAPAGAAACRWAGG